MLPTVSIGPVTLPVAPLLTIASFWIGLWLAAREGQRLDLNEDVIFNAGFYGAVGGLIGARLWYVVRYWSFYQTERRARRAAGPRTSRGLHPCSSPSGPAA